MKTLNIIGILLLFLFNNKIFAQNTYVTSVQGSNNVYAEDMIFTDNDEYILATTNPEEYSFRTICLSKLNYAGHLLWAKKYSITDDQLAAVKLTPTKNNGFIAVARLAEVPSKEYLVFKADSSGNVIWQKKIIVTPGDYTTYPANITEAKDESIYLVYGCNDDGIYVQKLDKDGTEIWNNFFYADTSNDEFKNFDLIIPASDDGLIISVTSWFRNDYYKFYNKLFKLSAKGLPEWKYTSIESSDNYTFSQMMHSDNDGKLNILYYAYDNYYHVILNPITGVSKAFDIGDNKFSLQFYIRTHSFKGLKGVAFPHGGLSSHFYGVTKNWGMVSAGADYNSHGHLKVKIEKYDSLGRICPDYTMPEYKYNNLKRSFDFTKSSFRFATPPGLLTMADAVLIVEPVNNVKTICAGEAEPFSSSSIESVNIKNYNFYTDITITPNPAKDYINLIVNAASPHFSKIEIVDFNGRVLKTTTATIIKGKNYKNINISSFPAGIYIVKISNLSGIKSQKIIKQ